MSHPYDLAEALDKLGRWTSTPVGRSRLQRVLKQFAGWDLLDAATGDVDRLLGDVDAARLYWITPTMLSLLDTASSEMPDQPLRAHDLPTGCGFVMCADELYLGGPEHQTIRAASWSVDTVDLDAARTVRFTIWWSRHIAAANNARSDADFRNAGIPPLLPVRWFDWQFDQTWRETYGIPIEPIDGVEDARLWVAHCRRWLQALFAIMGERYVTQTAPAANRAQRRRFERSGWDPDALRVIDLRRQRPDANGGGGGGDGAEWSHQWWVSGHWRNQWYPSRNEHRLRYIGPYTKGPQDKPLGAPPRRIFKIDTPDAE